MTRKSKLQPKVKEEEKVSLIATELARFQKQVDDILTAIESVNLLSIEEPEERLKAINTKVMISLKLPQLLASLDDLKNREKLKTTDVKGKKDLSLLEDGTLDD